MKGERRGKRNGEKEKGLRERKRKKEGATGEETIPLDTCLLSTFGSSGNKRRKAVRRQVYGHGINYRRFRTFLRKCNMRVDITLTHIGCVEPGCEQPKGGS